MTHNGPPTAVEDLRAWAVAWTGFAANVITFGVLFSFGVYLTPLAEEFDTTTGPVSGLFSAAVLVYYLSGAVGGRLGDRYGTRPVVGVGAVTIGVALLLAARADALWQLYVLYPVIGIAVGCCYPPLVGAVGQRFERRRVMAIAIVLAGVGAGTWIMPPVARWAVDTYGWRDTFSGWAVAATAVIGLVVVVVGRPPDATGGPAHQPVLARDLAGMRSFRRLYLAIILVSPGFYAPIAFLNDYAVDRQVTPGRAAALVGVIGGTTVITRFIVGALGPRFDGLAQYRLAYLVMTAGLIVWWSSGSSYVAMVAAASLHGVGWAVWVTAAPLVMVTWFGPRDLGGALGALYTGLGLGALLGPVVSGFIIDGAGYRWAVAVVVVTNLVAIAVARTVTSPLEA